MPDDSNIYQFPTSEREPVQQEPKQEVLSNEASARIVEWAGKEVTDLRDDVLQTHYGEAV